MLSDLRFAFRQLLKAPAFTVTALLTLALGIGATTIIYSVVHAVLLKPLDYPKPQQLVVLYETRDGQAGGGSVSPVTFMDWQRQAKSFSHFAATRSQPGNLTGEGEPRRIATVLVTAGYWDLFGVQPALGRTFGAEEDKPGANAVAVVSHAFWQQELGGSPAALNRTLQLNGRPVTIVGVMPSSFQSQGSTRLWLPMALTPDEIAERNRGSHYINVYARLRDGVGFEQGRREIEQLTARIAEEHPESKRGWTARVLPMLEASVGSQRGALLTLLGAVGALLLIACVNVANLLLARATSRLREFSLRAALGAAPGRIVRQLLAESLLLAALGGGLGVLLAYWGLDALLAFAPPGLPRLPGAHVDAAVLAAAAGLTLFCGFGFGLMPALQAARVNLVDALKDGARGTGEGARRGSLRSTLVVTEVALSLVLLVVAGLLMRSFTRLMSADPGFEPRGAVSLSVSLSSGKYGTPEKMRAFADAALARFAALPGVTSVGLIHSQPFTGSEWVFGVAVEGRPAVPEAEQHNAGYYAVGGDYFRAMGIPVVRGRAFAESDRAGAPRVAIISQTLANAEFPGEDPLGKRIHITNSRETVWREIVGVVPDVKQSSLDAPPEAQIYEPYAQRSYATLNFVIRTQAPAVGLAATLKQEIYAIDKDQPVTRVTPVAELVGSSLARQRFLTTLLAVFSTLALLLAAIGIYGVVSYNVTQRTSEYGVRLALGAMPGDVLRLVLVRCARLIAFGLVAGLALALAAGHWLASELYQTNASDPLVFTAISALLTGVAFIACLIPARRATKVDPISALRAE